MSLYRGPERRIGVQTRRVSALGGPIDMLALMQCRAGYHMEGTHKLFTNHDTLNARIASTKSSSGFPWDIRYYTATDVYAWITELNWTSPRDFKAVKTKYAVPFAFRYAYPGDVRTTKNLIDSQHVIYSACKFLREFNLGFIQHEFNGPYTINVGGDVGTVKNLYRVYYRWNGTLSGLYAVQEEFDFVPGFGQVGWRTRNWSSLLGGYGDPTASSVFNMLRAGNASTIFPCTYNP